MKKYSLKEEMKNEIKNVFEGYENIEKKRHAIQRYNIYIIMFLLGFIMTIINWSKSGIEFGFSIIMTLVGLIGQLLLIRKKVRFAGIFVAIIYIIFCSCAIINGINDGFAVLWTCMVPMGAMVIFELRTGTILCIIDIIVIFAIFYTPIYNYIYDYGDTFRCRFPILFASICIFSVIVEWVRFKDFNEVKKANLKLNYMAYKDQLTDVDNFNRFREKARSIMDKNKDTYYVMVAIDINKFKVINDKYGYKFGNEVLISLSNELRNICDEHEAFARVNADNFVMLLSYYDKDLLDVRIMNINELLRHCNYKYNLIINYGIYLIDDKSIDIWTLYDRALMAMELSYENESNNYNYYNEEIRKKLLNERFMEESMENALINKEFLVYFQPKYNLKKGKYTGAEALVRWRKDDGTIIPPGDFLSFFEKKGYITKIDLFVLVNVCERMKNWMDNGISLPVISVNISKMDIYKERFMEKVVEIVDSYNIPHEYIELEMTETLAAENLKEFITFANNCKRSGFKVSMDDFGSGYSSLTMLKELPIDIIKLDKSMFSDSISDDNFKKGIIIIEQVIKLSKKLDMKVVAEGIESKELVDLLKEMDCDMIQGFYYGKPMISDEFEKLLK